MNPSLKPQYNDLVAKGVRARDCPICAGHIEAGILALAPLLTPARSALICRASGDIIDDDNPPMALPNGQVTIHMC